MLIVYPAYILLVESFRGPSGGWSLTWYIQAYTSPRNLEAIVNTLIIACGTALFATMTGTGLAWAVVRTNVPGRRVIELASIVRSEERRVGKVCVSTFRSRWSP